MINNIIDFIISNWYIIFAILVVVLVIIGCAYNFLSLPTEAQLARIEEWLLWAVTEAEKELGEGTGQVKLRYVYDLFLSKFPWLSKLISFDTFSSLVDKALVKFKELLSSNQELQDYVYGEDD